MATVKLDGGPAKPGKPPPTHFLTNPNVGRRTGVDIKAGKNIRKDEDDHEVFGDYFSDKEPEDSFFDKSVSLNPALTSEPSKGLMGPPAPASGKSSTLTSRKEDPVPSINLEIIMDKSKERDGGIKNEDEEPRDVEIVAEGCQAGMSEVLIYHTGDIVFSQDVNLGTAQHPDLLGMHILTDGDMSYIGLEEVISQSEADETDEERIPIPPNDDSETAPAKSANEKIDCSDDSAEAAQNLSTATNTVHSIVNGNGEEDSSDENSVVVPDESDHIAVISKKPLPLSASSQTVVICDKPHTVPSMTRESEEIKPENTLRPDSNVLLEKPDRDVVIETRIDTPISGVPEKIPLVTSNNLEKMIPTESVPSSVEPTKREIQDETIQDPNQIKLSSAQNALDTEKDDVKLQEKESHNIPSKIPRPDTSKAAPKPTSNAKEHVTKKNPTIVKISAAECATTRREAVVLKEMESVKQKASDVAHNQPKGIINNNNPTVDRTSEPQSRATKNINNNKPTMADVVEAVPKPTENIDNKSSTLDTGEADVTYIKTVEEKKVENALLEPKPSNVTKVLQPEPDENQLATVTGAAPMTQPDTAVQKITYRTRSVSTDKKLEGTESRNKRNKNTGLPKKSLPKRNAGKTVKSGKPKAVSPSRKRYSEEIDVPSTGNRENDKGPMSPVGSHQNKHSSDEESSDDEGRVLMHYSMIDQEEDDMDDLAPPVPYPDLNSESDAGYIRLVSKKPLSANALDNLLNTATKPGRGRPRKCVSNVKKPLASSPKAKGKLAQRSPTQSKRSAVTEIAKTTLTPKIKKIDSKTKRSPASSKSLLLLKKSKVILKKDKQTQQLNSKPNRKVSLEKAESENMTAPIKKRGRPKRVTADSNLVKPVEEWITDEDVSFRVNPALSVAKDPFYQPNIVSPKKLRTRPWLQIHSSAGSLKVKSPGLISKGKKSPKKSTILAIQNQNLPSSRLHDNGNLDESFADNETSQDEAQTPPKNKNLKKQRESNPKSVPTMKKDQLPIRTRKKRGSASRLTVKRITKSPLAKKRFSKSPRLILKPLSPKKTLSMKKSSQNSSADSSPSKSLTKKPTIAKPLNKISPNKRPAAKATTPNVGPQGKMKKVRLSLVPVQAVAQQHSTPANATKTTNVISKTPKSNAKANLTLQSQRKAALMMKVATKRDKASLKDSIRYTKKIVSSFSGKKKLSLSRANMSSSITKARKAKLSLSRINKLTPKMARKEDAVPEISPVAGPSSSQMPFAKPVSKHGAISKVVFKPKGRKKKGILLQESSVSEQEVTCERLDSIYDFSPEADDEIVSPKVIKRGKTKKIIASQPQPSVLHGSPIAIHKTLPADPESPSVKVAKPRGRPRFAPKQVSPLKSMQSASNEAGPSGAVIDNDSLSKRVESASQKNDNKVQLSSLKRKHRKEQDTETSMEESATKVSKRHEIANDSTLSPVTVGKKPTKSKKHRLLPIPSKGDGTPGVRRSRRPQIPPLQYWRHERAVYKKSKSGSMHMVGIEPGNQNQIGLSPLTKALMARVEHDKRQLNKNVVKKRLNKVRKSEHNLSIHNVSRAESGVELTMTEPSAVRVLNSATGEEEEIEIIRSHRTLAWVGPYGKTAVPGDPYIVSKFFNTEAFSCGFLKIRPSQAKPLEMQRDHSMTFVIKFGKLKVQVNDNVWIMETDDGFMVPDGNAYRIENLRHDEATLTFFSSQITGD